jgi:hypothetical protein
MNLHDHRLAAILQIRTALVARMFELRDLRRRVQTAQLSPTKASALKTALFESLDANSIGRPNAARTWGAGPLANPHPFFPG